ncbi:hypothetical protein INT47_003691 [Mucor saturninus]|uniref:tRNA nucleotidyltransferase n=1 Tax=Mucor saturninus TaxID=64648 RepID=A0A8H7R9B7_9FUNG|nr:hypothetical protein INT47_003691 [Mucor saturninus]
MFRTRTLFQRAMTTYGVSKHGHVMKVELNETETKICSVLQGVTSFIHQQRPELPLIVSRIAGGWVRDKLLGKECHDLDIAINDMMGYEYATYVNQYLKAQGVPVRSIAKIDSNPEKSKHLETATTKLFDQEVDFCNLRTEIYEQGSRIPSQITFGTPEEDAYRRDITINSLFYNVNTNQVEDFTQQGIPDLKEGWIRTPLAPFETFHDDPLRVIRCIRFSSRFNFTMVPELCEAAKHPDIKDALIHKISRERIGIEFEKMITGPHPLLSLVLIHQLDLYTIMMTPPNVIKSGVIAPDVVAVHAVGILTWLIDRQAIEVNASEKRALVLASSVLPYYGVISETKKKVLPAVQLVLRDAIKSNNTDVATVSTLFKGIEQLQTLAARHAVQHLKRSELGMVIRELGGLWKTAVKMTMIKEMADTYALDWTKGPDDPTIGKEILTKYNGLMQTATEYGIEDCYTWKHMVDGKRAAQLVGQKPGPIVNELLKVQMIWQLDHPGGQKEECEQAIQAYWASK